VISGNLSVSVSTILALIGALAYPSFFMILNFLNPEKPEGDATEL